MHITIPQNVNIWGLPLRFDIINYLIPMWHVGSNKFLFPFCLSFGSCLCEFAWCGLPLIWFSIYYVRNHLFHIILTMALPVGLNSWNYQQTLSKYGVLFLIFCHMLVCCEVGLEHHSYIPPRNISIYSLSMTSDTRNCGGFCRPSSYWLLHWIALFIVKIFILTPVVFLTSWMDPIFQLV